MKKKILIYGSIVVALLALFLFNKLVSAKKNENLFAEVRKGLFEISVDNAGELVAEKSLDIIGPRLGMASNQQDNQQGGQQGGGGTRGGGSMGGGSFSSGGGGMRVQSVNLDIRAMEFKILDMVPEGTIVRQGDYVAQIDRTNYENTLKDAVQAQTNARANYEMTILDTAMTLSSLRDEIKNLRYQVEEARITLDQSKFEPPATIRKAQMQLDKSERSLEQTIKAYELRKQRAFSDIQSRYITYERQNRLVEDLEAFLAQFRVTAPSDGMVIYKKDRLGNKIKTGSQLHPFDMVVATLPDLTTMLSKVYVNEIEVAKVKPGLPVVINVDAIPGKSYTGKVITVANIGETLPNSDSKMFEVMVKIDGTDMNLRPAMTSWNRVVLKSVDNAVFIPLEAVRADADSVSYVYKKNHTRQIVILGEINDKFAIVQKGLEPGTMIYLSKPEEADEFRLVGRELLASGNSD